MLVIHIRIVKGEDYLFFDESYLEELEYRKNNSRLAGAFTIYKIEEDETNVLINAKINFVFETDVIFDPVIIRERKLSIWEIDGSNLINRTEFRRMRIDCTYIVYISLIYVCSFSEFYDNMSKFYDEVDDLENY